MGLMQKIIDNGHYSSLFYTLCCFALAIYFLVNLIEEEELWSTGGFAIFGICAIWSLWVTVKEFKAVEKAKESQKESED